MGQIRHHDIYRGPGWAGLSAEFRFEKTARIGGEMKEFNPDNNWTLVQDEGVATAAMEKEQE